MGKHKQHLLKDDQRGLHVIGVLVGILVLLIIILVAASVGQKSSAPRSAKQTVSDKASDCVKAFNDADYCKFAANYNLEKSTYKLSAAAVDANGTTNITYLSDGRGNSSEADVGPGGETDTIFYNGIPYLKDRDGQWFKFDRGDQNAPKYGNPLSGVRFLTSVDKDGTNLAFLKLDSEKCGQVTCLKYQVTDSSQPALSQYFWFDTATYRLQRFSSKDPNSSLDASLSYQPVRIKAPAPTKDFVPPDSNGDNSDNSSN